MTARGSHFGPFLHRASRSVGQAGGLALALGVVAAVVVMPAVAYADTTGSAVAKSSDGPLHPYILGFATALTLFVAIGPQNAFVLRQGVRDEHVLPVVTFCAAADFVLVAAGIAGVGVLITRHPELTSALRYGGAAFLVGYGLLAARRAIRPTKFLAPAGQGPVQLGTVLMTCAAVTFLNPHIYLDDVVLLGGLANQQGEHRWVFGAGVAAASAAWFLSLGLGARRLSGLFAKPGTWRYLDGLVAVTMIGLALSLAAT